MFDHGPKGINPEEAPQEGLQSEEAIELSGTATVEEQSQKLTDVVENTSDAPDEVINFKQRRIDAELKKLDAQDQETIDKYKHDDTTDEELDKIFGSELDVDLEGLIATRNGLLSEVQSASNKKKQLQAIRNLQRLHVSDRDRFDRIRNQIFEAISQNTQYFSSAEELELLDFIKEGMPTKDTYDILKPWTVINEEGKRTLWPQILKTRKAKVKGRKILFNEDYKKSIDAGGHFQPDSSKNRISAAPTSSFHTLAAFITTGGFTEKTSTILHEVTHEQQYKSTKDAFNFDSSIKEIHAERASRDPSHKYPFEQSSSKNLADSIAGETMTGRTSPRTGRQMYETDPDIFTTTLLTIDSLYALGATEQQIWDAFKGVKENSNLLSNLNKLISELSNKRGIKRQDLFNLRTAWRLESQIDRLNISKITADIVIRETQDFIPEQNTPFTFDTNRYEQEPITNETLNAWDFAQKLIEQEKPFKVDNAEENFEGILTSENYSQIYFDKFKLATDLEYQINNNSSTLEMSMQDATIYLKQLHDLYENNSINIQEYQQKFLAVEDFITSCRNTLEQQKADYIKISQELSQIATIATERGFPAGTDILPKLNLEDIGDTIVMDRLNLAPTSWSIADQYRNTVRDGWILDIRKDTDSFTQEIVDNNPDILKIDRYMIEQVPQAGTDFDIPDIYPIEINCAIYCAEHLPVIARALERVRKIQQFMVNNTNIFQSNSTSYITHNLNDILTPYNYVKPSKWEALLSNQKFREYVTITYGAQRLGELNTLISQVAN